MKTKTYYIRTHSPLSIGSGKTLSPLIDYILNGDLIYYIDEDKLTDLLNEKGLIEIFAGKVHSQQGKEKTYLLKSFLKENGITDLTKIYKIQRPHHLNAKSKATEISCIIKSNNHPYIPGSSIKGAFSTYILFHYLKNNPEKLQSFISQIPPLYSTFEEYRTKLKGDSKEIEKQEKKKLSELSIILDEYFETKIEKLFYILNQKQKPLMANLQVNDTFIEERTQWAVYQSSRTHLRERKKTFSSILREAIEQNTIFKTGLKITETEEDNKNKGLDNLDGLWKIVNETNKAWLKHELETWEKQLKHLKNKKLANDVIQFYRHLLNEVKSGKKFICLGFGKNYFFNSIGLLIKEKDEKAFELLRKIYKMGKEGQKFFPVTRAIFIENNKHVPLGWVEFMDEPTLPVAPPQTLSLTKHEGKLKKGLELTAKLIKIGKPLSIVEVLVNNNNIQCEMTHTKDAKKIKPLNEGMILWVEITSIKDQQIKQVKFKSF